MLVKNLWIVLLLAVISSCGNNTASPTGQTATAVNTDDENISNIEIFRNTDCATCHKRTETFVGPALTAIADRYKDAADTTVTNLALTIINGSTGKWQGSVTAMTQHPALSKEDAKKMVEYILKMKK